jgi:hypothetical protein
MQLDKGAVTLTGHESAPGVTKVDSMLTITP